MTGEIFDPRPLTELAETFEADFASELLELYLSELDELTSAIEKGLPESDPEGWCRAAHRLKSSSRQVGALALADLCERIEADPGADPEGMAQQFTKLLDTTRAVIEAEREMLPGS